VIVPKTAAEELAGAKKALDEARHYYKKYEETGNEEALLYSQGRYAESIGIYEKHKYKLTPEQKADYINARQEYKKRKAA